jgi:arylsulfatase A-like enzyme
MDTRRSLLLITVDCLRAGHLGFMGYERPTTPFLDSLSEESLVLRNAIVAGSPTFYSFPAIMASRHPLAFGRDVVGLAPDEATIATSLSQSGYATAAFTAANPYISARFGYAAGFDTFRDFLGQNDRVPEDGQSALEASADGPLRSRLNLRLMRWSEAAGPLSTSLYHELYFRYCQWLARSPAASYDQLRRFPAADVLVNHACEWLAGTAGRPFFLWLHFMDPHAPYYPGDQALRLLGARPANAGRALYLNSYWRRNELHAPRLERHREEIVTLYDAGVRWVDEQVGRLVSALRQQELWNNCVMAFGADHGEEFLDHGGRYHSPSKVTEELIHVPLLLRVPDMQKESVEIPFSLVDLAPTLLEMVGVEVPLSFRGQSRWKPLQKGQAWDGTSIVECVTSCTNPFDLQDRLGGRILAIREERYKLVLDLHSSSELLFDLKNDPSEQRPLPDDKEKPIRRRLLEGARRHLVESLQARDLESRLRARLRDVRLQWEEAGQRAGIETVEKLG